MAWSRETRQSRGYGEAWQRLRKLVLERDNHLCQCPRCMGGAIRLREASEVDHRVPKADGGSDDIENLRAVHPRCHQRITIEQRGFKPAARYDRNGRRRPDE